MYGIGSGQPMDGPGGVLGSSPGWREYDRELSTLLDEIPRATSAPPHLEERQVIPGLDPRFGGLPQELLAGISADQGGGQFDPMMHQSYQMQQQQQQQQHQQHQQQSGMARKPPMVPASQYMLHHQHKDSGMHRPSPLGGHSLGAQGLEQQGQQTAFSPLSLLGDPHLLDRPRSAIDLTAYSALSMLSGLSLNDNGQMQLSNSSSGLPGGSGSSAGFGDLHGLPGHLAGIGLVHNALPSHHGQPSGHHINMGGSMSNPTTPAPLDGMQQQMHGMHMPHQQGGMGMDNNAIAALAAAAASNGMPGGQPVHMQGHGMPPHGMQLPQHGGGMPHMQGMSHQQGPHGMMPMPGMPGLPPQMQPQAGVMNTLEYQAAFQAALYVQQQQQALLMAQNPQMMGNPGFIGMPGQHDPMQAAAAAAAQAAVQDYRYYPGSNAAAIAAAAAAAAAAASGAGRPPEVAKEVNDRDNHRGHRGKSNHNGGGRGGRGGGAGGGGGGGGGAGGGNSNNQFAREADPDRDDGQFTCKYSTLEEVVGNLLDAAQDQNGCRFLQRKFDEGGPTAVAVVLPEVLDHLVELMMDPFGNYLVQKMLDRCSEEQRLEVLKRIADRGDLVSVALNTHGTRAVQKLIETLAGKDQVQIVIQALRKGVVSLIKDLNGNHVVQRCLQRLGPEDSQFIYDAAVGYCVEIATHRHGCCVLQRCIDFATESQKARLVDEIARRSLVLSQDPFGNYVVQYVLELGQTEHSAKVMTNLFGHYPDLSVQKFSSNVVEKCLKLGGRGLQEVREQVVREVMTSPQLPRLLQDPYGNYVVQSSLQISSGQLHQELVEHIRPFLSTLRGTPHGKRILAKLNGKI